jgi:cytochrome c5
MLRVAPAAVTFAASLALLAAGLARTPTAADLAPVNLPPDQLAFLRTCSTCHPPYDPRTHKQSEWRPVVNEMHLRAKDREINVAAEQLEAAIRWLEAHGR